MQSSTSASAFLNSSRPWQRKAESTTRSHRPSSPAPSAALPRAGSASDRDRPRSARRLHPAVRLLRRRRSRLRIPGDGPDRPGRQHQREPIRFAATRLWWLHQHHTERRHGRLCGTLTTNGLELDVGNGELAIEREGDQPKFLESVEQITFSGEYAREIDQPVRYVTERAVFDLREDGFTLVEIAPGIDLEADVPRSTRVYARSRRRCRRNESGSLPGGAADLTEYVN